jgi:hypothetical protein
VQANANLFGVSSADRPVRPSLLAQVEDIEAMHRLRWRAKRARSSVQGPQRR